MGTSARRSQQQTALLISLSEIIGPRENRDRVHLSRNSRQAGGGSPTLDGTCLDIRTARQTSQISAPN